MRAVTITSRNDEVSPNIIVQDDWPTPSARPGEVLVRTEASALNHLDLWVGRGLPGADEFPRISGSDGCGRVEAVGEGVDESWIGRRVLLNAAVCHHSPHLPDVIPTDPALHMIGETLPGTHAEYFTAPAANVLDIGESDPVQAAAFALSFLTSWRMLMSRARLKAGQQVLITGIGGGVALSCLAICRWLGCTTIVTSRHDWKLERARELGADHVVLDSNADAAILKGNIAVLRNVEARLDGEGVADNDFRTLQIKQRRLVDIEAYAVAREAGTVGPLLGRLFQATFSTAKTVRTDTAIGENPVSVAFAAVSLAKQIFADLHRSQALLIGAGETISLVARHLYDQGIKRIVVANRTLERASQLAEQFGAHAVLLSDIPDELAHSDIVISS